MRVSRVWLWVSLVAVMLIVGVGSLALAEGIPGQGVINACVSRIGIPRIVVSLSQCRKDEKSLAWNIKGDPGSAGMLRFYQRESTLTLPACGEEDYALKVLDAKCDPGDKATGGGLDVSGLGEGIMMFRNAPLPPGADGSSDGWGIEFKDVNCNTEIAQAVVYVLCADVTP